MKACQDQSTKEKTYISEDNTDHKQVEEELRRSVQNLKLTNARLQQSIRHANQLVEETNRANQAKSEFLANMSHEIRTPMNCIIGFSDLLAEEELTEHQHMSVNIIKESGKTLLNLINDILDFSKIEAGKLDVEVTDCSLTKILNPVESMMKLKAEESGIEFKVIEGHDLPATIRTDTTRVSQCLVNLVSNAMKFTEQGHVHIRVSMVDKKDTPYIRFAVEDTGIGIPEDKQQAIFESFAQADESTTRTHGGTGLGLSITKQLAGLLGGEITLTSRVGMGSVFSLVIPTTIPCPNAQR
jgi:signal transduction histidine kinase